MIVSEEQAIQQLSKKAVKPVSGTELLAEILKEVKRIRVLAFLIALPIILSLIGAAIGLLIMAGVIIIPK